jgi:AAA15 family ATPase/GTPase
MIDSLEIHNFRCFENASLSSLKQINIVVGKSASGKTAFLESLFIACGASPELPIRVRAWRGLPVATISDQKAVYEALWKDLFYSFDQSREISVLLRGSRLHTRIFNVSYKDSGDLIPLDVKTDSRKAESIRPITFSWTDGAGRPFVVQPEVKGGQLVARMVLQPQTPTQSSPAISFYSSSILPSPEENAQYFSDLSVKHEEAPIVEFMRQEFEFIENLGVESFARTPTIYASVRGLPEKQPINMVSTGITKLLSILLGMANQGGGIILIDEMENGIYWDRLSSIWDALLSFAERYDVQIFATTHSMECLEAAAQAAANHEDKFSLMRVEKSNGGSVIRQFTGKAFRSAIRQGGEVR